MYNFHRSIQYSQVLYKVLNIYKQYLITEIITYEVELCTDIMSRWYTNIDISIFLFKTYLTSFTQNSNLHL